MSTNARMHILVLFLGCCLSACSPVLRVELGAPATPTPEFRAGWAEEITARVNQIDTRVDRLEVLLHIPTPTSVPEGVTDGQ